MKNTFIKITVQLFLFLLSNSVFSQSNNSDIQIKKDGLGAQLYVNNQPYLILGGELGNSTASSISYMQPYWDHLVEMNVNTVLVPVYWELMEPEENKFDFALVDYFIKEAKQKNIKIVFLWFGTWKNSMSCYAPLWMKTNPTRFPRTYDTVMRSQEIFSVFGKETVESDKKAFVALLKHIKETDFNKTVIMVQVENEIGMLPTAREHSKIADATFNDKVPNELMTYLQKNKNNLMPFLYSKWEQNGFLINDTWEKTFGAGLSTDEIFQAWYYAKYANEVAAAGKLIYNIPMNVNAALPRPGKLPGQYPSAGPLPHLMDIWKAAAPSINMLSPDFYNPDTEYWCDLYTKKDNVLFVPEMQFDKSAAPKALFIIGHYKALGFSPFSIENTNEASVTLQKSYSLLKQLSPIILQKKWQAMDGFLLDKKNKTKKIVMGQYVLTISHQATMTWSPESKDSVWTTTGGIILQTGPHDFLISGTGFVVTFKNLNQELVTNIATADEVKYIDGKEILGRRMNGDQDHQGRHIEFAIGNWGIQKVKLYNAPVVLN